MNLQIGGPVEPTRLYLRRPEDDRLQELLARGEFCHVLTARQMGKSSLIGRVSMLLAQEGLRVAYVDLKGSLNDRTADDWYPEFLEVVTHRLGIDVDAAEFWDNERGPPNERLLRFFKEHLVHEERSTIVVLDEIDNLITFDWRHEIFAALRAFHNERQFDARFRRLTFCLVGCAAVDELLHDPQNTPYNIGTLVELSEFDLIRDHAELAKLGALIDDAGLPSAEVLERVFWWTGGQPFLTMYWCDWLLSRSSDAALPLEHADGWRRAVDALGARVLARREPPCELHVLSIQTFLEDRGGDQQRILDIHEAALRDRKVDQRHVGSIELNRILVSGLHVRDDGRRTRLKNRLYARWFDKSWIAERRPKLSLLQRTIIRNAMIAFGTLVVAGAAFVAYKLARDADERHREERRLKVAEVEARFEGCQDLRCARAASAELTRLDEFSAREHQGRFLDKQSKDLQFTAQTLFNDGCVEQAGLLTALAYLKTPDANHLPDRLVAMGVGRSRARWWRREDAANGWKPTDCKRPEAACSELLRDGDSVLGACAEGKKPALGVADGSRARLADFTAVRSIVRAPPLLLATTEEGAVMWRQSDSAPSPVDLVPDCGERTLRAIGTAGGTAVATWCTRRGINGTPLAIVEWSSDAVSARKVVLRPTLLEHGEGFLRPDGWEWIGPNSLLIGTEDGLFAASREGSGKFGLHRRREGHFHVLGARAGGALVYAPRTEQLSFVDGAGRARWSRPRPSPLSPESAAMTDDRSLVLLTKRTDPGELQDAEVWEIPDEGAARRVDTLRTLDSPPRAAAYSARGEPLIAAGARLVTLHEQTFDTRDPGSVWREAQEWAGLTVGPDEDEVRVLEGPPGEIDRHGVTW